MGIHGHLQVAKDAGRILNLINDYGGRIALKETLRFLLGLLGFGGEIEGHERVIRKQVPESRGLAGLPGTGQDDHRPRLRRAF
jgi:hypothetical protein